MFFAVSGSVRRQVQIEAIVSQYFAAMSRLHYFHECAEPMGQLKEVRHSTFSTFLVITVVRAMRLDPSARHGGGGSATCIHRNGTRSFVRHSATSEYTAIYRDANSCVWQQTIPQASPGQTVPQSYTELEQFKGRVSTFFELRKSKPE
jgi:hypothetical protein